jgi:hypothetical protein
MKVENKATAKGIGFTGLLAVAFIVLKLCHVIDWSWLWVLAPIWIPIALVILIGVIFVLYAIIADKKDEKVRKKSES